MMIKAIIFDMDGVIVDTKMLHFLAWEKFWGKKGIKHTFDDFMKNFGKDNKVIFSEMYNGISEEEIEVLSREKESYYKEFAKGKIKPSPGAVELIRNLRRNNYPIALATSSPRHAVEFVIGQIKLEKYFDAIVTSSEVKFGKPEPEIFLKAAEKLAVKPEECVVIEDSLHGIEAARRAGMKCIAVATTHKEEELKHADLIRKDLSKVTVEDIKGLK